MPAPKMAASKSAKRSTQVAVPAPEAKKPKLDPLVVGVVDAIRQAEGLSEDCRLMLKAGAPNCFATPAGERHHHQEMMAAWIGQVVDGVRSRLEEAVESADAEELDAVAKQKDLEGKIEQGKAALADADSAVVAKQAGLKDASQAVASAESELQARKDAQVQGDAESSPAREERELLDRTLETDMQFLKTEEGYDLEKAAEHMKTLAPVARRLLLDESLVVAIQPAAMRPPSERGTFDHTVLAEVEASLRKKLSDVEAQLEAAAPGIAERAAAVAAAEAALEQAQEEHRAATEALSTAQTERSDAASALAGAESALEAFVRERSLASAAREEKAAALQNFVGYNVECFRMLSTEAATAGA